VFEYEPERLVAYHYLVMNEMKQRGYHPDEIWYNENWRGSTIGEQEDWCEWNTLAWFLSENPIYPEHNDEYLQECIENLKGKGIEIC
jgi:uncharacterized protein (TIGR02328 family)